ncbi:MAG: hypothetical protein ACAI43_11815 [Phycisphaerae bacterium]
MRFHPTHIVLVLVLAIAPLAGAAPVNDGGRFFTATAREQAAARLDVLAKKAGRSAVFETFDEVPAGQELAKFAQARAAASGVKGVYVIIVRRGGAVGVLPDKDTQAVLAKAAQDELRDGIIAGLRKGEKHFDQALLDAVTYLEDKLAGKPTDKPATRPAGPSPAAGPWIDRAAREVENLPADGRDAARGRLIDARLAAGDPKGAADAAVLIEGKDARLAYLAAARAAAGDVAAGRTVALEVADPYWKSIAYARVAAGQKKAGDRDGMGRSLALARGAARDADAKADGDRRPALTLLAVAEAEMDEPDAADATIADVPEGAARDGAYAAVAAAHLRAGRLPAARAAIDKIKFPAVREAALAEHVGRTLATASPAEAIRLIDALPPTAHGALSRAAIVLATRGDVRTATRLLDRLADAPELPDVALTIAQVHAEGGDALAAREAVALAAPQVAKAEPAARAKLLRRSAAVLATAGDAAGAKRAFDEAEKLATTTSDNPAESALRTVAIRAGLKQFDKAREAAGAMKDRRAEAIRAVVHGQVRAGDLTGLAEWIEKLPDARERFDAYVATATALTK